MDIVETHPSLRPHAGHHVAPLENIEATCDGEGGIANSTFMWDYGGYTDVEWGTQEFVGVFCRDCTESVVLVDRIEIGGVVFERADNTKPTSTTEV